MNDWHLFRSWYRTDFAPGSVGNISDTIPGRALADGRQIVHVDWSVPGEVEVTFLIPGPGR